MNYILLGLLWVAACLGLGAYIRAGHFSSRNYTMIGLSSIFVFYLIGVILLFVIIIMS
jgi:hypothetical protein